MEDTLDWKTRAIAIGSVLLFFGLIWFYVSEFPVFNNTIGVKWLVIGGMLFGLLSAAGFLFWKRERFMPVKKHVPEILTILVLNTLFMPLFCSWLNRGLGRNGQRTFDFLSETPFVPTRYALIREKKMRPEGYELFVRDGYQGYKFRYKKQAYYPLTKAGEKVLLPVRNGLLGFAVVVLE